MKNNTILILGLMMLIGVTSNAQSSNSEILKEIDLEIQKAINVEDYTKAKHLKQEKELRIKIAIAIKDGDFDKAEELKSQLNTPKNDVPLIKNDSDESVTLVFKKIRKSLTYDIVINDQYVGTINSKEDVIVKNITTGTYEIALFGAGGPNMEKFRFLSEETINNGGTYVANFIDMKPREYASILKQQKKNRRKGIKEYVKLFNLEKATSQNTSMNEGQDFVNLQFEEKRIWEATMSYSGFGININQLFTDMGVDPKHGDGYSKFNFKGFRTLPIVKNTGLIAGYELGFGSLVYPSVTNWSWFILSSFGYQLEVNPFITLQSQLKVGPVFNLISTETSGTTIDRSLTVGFGGSMNFAGFFFFNKRQRGGISTELSVDFKGAGTSISVGWVSGIMTRHKYRNTFYKR